jgi:hypothetical protein
MFGEPAPMRIEGLHGKALKKGETPPVLRVYLQHNAKQWEKATPAQRGEHLNTSVRLFSVLVKTQNSEVDSHEN